MGGWVGGWVPSHPPLADAFGDTTGPCRRGVEEGGWVGQGGTTH